MSDIHQTAVIDDNAKIGKNIKIGPYCIVGPDVELADGVVLETHVVVNGHTKIGANTKIFPYASIGLPPQDMKYKGEPSELIIGCNNIIREYVTINPGTEGGGMLTEIGNNCLFMVGSHVAHDCQIGDHVVLVNNATLGGHVTLDEWVIIGGLSAVHQFARVGRHAMVGGMTGVEHDVIPYGSVTGNRARLQGLNIVGLKRRGFDREQIHELRNAYRLLFAPEGTMAERLEDVAKLFIDNKLVMEIVRFIRADSSRAICQPILEDAALVIMLPKLGILAGGGVLPAQLMQACIETGRSYFVIAIEDQTDPEILKDHPYAWVRLGAVGKAIEILRNEKVEELVMIGPVRRPSLSSLRPDAWLTKRIAKIGLMSRGDDGLLSKLIIELEAEGFRVIGPDVALTELVASDGIYGAIAPDDIALIDIERGLKIAKGLGGLDVGQAVVVQQGLVLAVEAIEGTDEMLRRAAKHKREGPGGVLVKVKKPEQEQRVDLPTIGVNTVEMAAEAGLRGIAIQSGHALIVDRTEVVRLADLKGLFITGITTNE